MKTGKQNDSKRSVSGKFKKRNESRPTESRNSLCEGLFFVLTGLTLFFFLVQPCFSTEDSPIRFLYMLVPFLEPGAILEHFWGSDLLTFTPIGLGYALWERIQTLLVAGVSLIAATGLGFLLMRFEPATSTRTPLESFFFASVSGLALWSGLFCWFGLAGLARQPLVIVLATCASALYAVYYLLHSLRRGPDEKIPAAKITHADGEQRGILFARTGTVLLVLFLAGFALLYLLGAMIPTCEYDMLEYHLQGSREFYESGTIAFSRHNIYMNMPLGAEMFHLWGMNLTRDVFAGALVGKTIIALTAILASLGVGLFVQRVTGTPQYALFAAVVYLSFSINFDVFANGLNDGVPGLVIVAVSLIALPTKNESSRLPSPLLTGSILAMAVATKYTAVVFVLLPILVVLVVAACRKKIECKFTTVTLFLLAFLWVCGGWYFKNWIATGNPFHPLLYTIWGDSSGTWDAAQNLRWTKAHWPDGFTISSLVNKFTSFTWTSITASPFFVLTVVAGILAVPRLICKPATSSEPGGELPADCVCCDDRQTRKIIFALTVACTYYLVVWWAATHRIERFIVPVLPIVAILFTLFCSTIFRYSTSSRTWRSGWLLLFALWYPLAFSPMLQTNYFLPRQVVKQDPARFGDWAVWFNNHREVRKFPPGEILLLIGQAQAFSYDGPVLYNTCWDASPLTPILEGNVRYDPSRKTVLEIIHPDVIRRKLKERGIGWILFDEGEWRRFGQPGNYGMTNPAINGHLLRLLVDSKVVKPYRPTEAASFASYAKHNIFVFRLYSE